MNFNIEIVSAPSILGLKPTGVELLGQSLIDSGLEKVLNTRGPVKHIQTLNDQYSYERDPETKCLNPKTIRDFSQSLSRTIGDTVTEIILHLFLEVTAAF